MLAIGRLRTLARWTRANEGRVLIWCGNRVAVGGYQAALACTALQPVGTRDQAMPACSTTSMAPMFLASNSSSGNRWPSKILFIAANPRIRERVFAAERSDSPCRQNETTGPIGECFHKGSIPTCTDAV